MTTHIEELTPSARSVVASALRRAIETVRQHSIVQVSDAQILNAMGIAYNLTLVEKLSATTKALEVMRNAADSVKVIFLDDPNEYSALEQHRALHNLYDCLAATMPQRTGVA